MALAVDYFSQKSTIVDARLDSKHFSDISLTLPDGAITGYKINWEHSINFLDELLERMLFF